MRTLVAAALTTATLLCASPQSAEAQVLWRPWLRPRVVVVPPRVILPVAAPPVVMGPRVYVQPYPQTYYYPPPPPPVYVQPAPPVYVQPAPPVYVQPAPPVYVQPAPPVVEQQVAPPQEQYAPLPPPPVYMQPAPVQQPVYVQPAPPPALVQAAPVQPVAPPPAMNVVTVQRPVLPQWKSRFGIGARFVGAVSLENQDFSDRFTQLGFGGELLYRANRRVVIELGGEYQKRMSNGFERYDIPVTIGARLHIGAPDWVVSPYFVTAVGGVYSNLDYVRSQDKAWFLDGQLGGGLEVRLGQHVVLNADLRGDGRYRLNDPDATTQSTQKVNGVVLSPLGNQYGLQARLGAAVYF
ncbi:MAG: outer membrane beta-barrel protein [Myxococcales bacterium]|nr:outer membrane beta-barrel protein [Myxococcales bacterium]